MNQGITLAGAGVVDITPRTPQFLYGYPHVPRVSTGTFDPLYASSLYLEDGLCGILFVSCDVVKFSKALATRFRKRIEKETGVAFSRIFLTATHTHSGPVTVRMLANEADSIVPPPDPEYLAFLEEGIVRSAREAWESRQACEISIVETCCSGIGTNRHDPDGPADPRVPVLYARNMMGNPIGIMVAANMHPTVLHEDSTLFSGDFPGLMRRYLQEKTFGADCPVLFQMGTAGNQSPRHVTKGNTFEEAKRLGEILGVAVSEALEGAEFSTQVPLRCLSAEVDLPARTFPSPEEAETQLLNAQKNLAELRAAEAPKAEIRTAECDLFGAEKTLMLASADRDGRLKAVLESVLPAEIHVVAVGGYTFVCWPGEVFVEFGLEVAAHRPHTHVLTLCNGDYQGYLVSAQAVEQSFYEAGTAILKSPESGERLVQATIRLIDQLSVPTAG